MRTLRDCLVGWYVYRLRWWWRVKRGRCPLGPPPPCPEFEEIELTAVTHCITEENPCDSA